MMKYSFSLFSLLNSLGSRDTARRLDLSLIFFYALLCTARPYTWCQDQLDSSIPIPTPISIPILPPHPSNPAFKLAHTCTPTHLSRAYQPVPRTTAPQLYSTHTPVSIHAPSRVKADPAPAEDVRTDLPTHPGPSSSTRASERGGGGTSRPSRRVEVPS